MMGNIVIDLHMDAKTAFNIAFWGIIGYKAAKTTIKVVNDICTPAYKKYQSQHTS